jgi:uronate dehydrogenase
MAESAREGLVYEAVYGISDNSRALWDDNRASELGYRPEGKAESVAEEAFRGQAALRPDEIGDFFQGGPFCSLDYLAPFAPAPTSPEGL